MVVNAPSWFNLIWRVASPYLAERTRAKIKVLTHDSEAAAELESCLGPRWVPEAYGGTCKEAYEQFPVQKGLLEFVEKLQKE
jgi:hypothetical protein